MLYCYRYELAIAYYWEVSLIRINIKKLIILMYEHGLNNQQLANKSNVSRVTVSNIKCGKSCSSETVFKIAEALDISIDDLIEN